MRLDFIRSMAVAGGVLLLPATPVEASTASDFKLCLTADTSNYDSEVEDACDSYIDADTGKASDRAKAYLARSKVIAADDDYETAIEDLDESIKLVATVDAHVLRGFLLMDIEEFDKAIEDANWVIKKDRRNADAYYLRGRSAYESIDDTPYDSEEDLTRAIELNPDYDTAYLWRGHLHANNDEIDEAIADYTSSIRITANAPAYYARAQVYYDDDHCRMAVKDLDRAIKLAPKYTNALSLRAECLNYLTEYENAIADYSAVLQIKPRDPDTSTARADIYLKTNDYDRAIADYTVAMEVDPQTYRYVWRGRGYMIARRFEEAIADYKKVLDLGVVASNLYLQLGKAYLALGDDANAAPALAKALELADAEAAKNTSGLVIAARGDVYFALKKYDEALADYTSAIKVLPQSPNGYRSRADVYEAMDKADEAAADRAKAKQIDAADLEAENYVEEADADAADNGDDEGWGAKGPGTIQKLH